MMTITFEEQLQLDIADGIDDIYEYIMENQEELTLKPDLYRQYFINDPEWAYQYALNVDMEALGKLADQEVAFNTTRTATLTSPMWAYCYAASVDEAPRTDTREATFLPVEEEIEEGLWPFCYAFTIDECARQDTYDAVKGTDNEEVYIQELGRP